MTKKPETVADLAPNPKNPRRITKDAKAALDAAMKRFGDLGVIVKNVRTGKLIGGHQRVSLLDPKWPITKQPLKDKLGTVAVGWIQAPEGPWAYREVDWDEATETAAMIAANNNGGENDMGKLGELVVELDGLGFDTAMLGFGEGEMARFLAGEADKNEDAAPQFPPGKPKAQRGDLFILGDHRLLVGDSTNPQDVSRLMGKDQAAVVNTDPPYGVSYVSASGKFEMIKNDDKTGDALFKMLAGALARAVAHAKPDAAFYIWHASSTREDFAAAMKAVGLVEQQYLIWAKPSLTLGRADYQWAHEPCFYASRDGEKPAFYGDRAEPTIWRASLRRTEGVVTVVGQGVILRDGKGGTLVVTAKAVKGKKLRALRVDEKRPVLLAGDEPGGTVWEVGRDSDTVHPTQKPVELARRAIQNSSKEGEVVLDLFGGSGSTLIAAEVTGRAARLMELDPKYADAIVRRWEDFTGRKAVKEDAAPAPKAQKAPGRKKK